jgi:hypothetical protein
MEVKGLRRLGYNWKNRFKMAISITGRVGKNIQFDLRSGDGADRMRIGYGRRKLS